MQIPRWTLRVAAVAAVVAAFLPARLAAQGVTTGAVSGTVTDAQGKPVEGAQVQVISRETGFTAGANTRSTGYYFVQGLEIGTYTVRVRRIGYQPAERANIVVSLSASTRVDVQLASQAVSLGTVSVKAASDAAEFSASRQGVATTVSDTLIRRLPMLTRDYTSLVRLTPQVSTAMNTNGPSANGAYNRLNNFTIDGANQNDRFNLNGSGGQPGGAANSNTGNSRTISPEAIKEVKVVLNPTDVRQGNFAGMLVNAVTRSGTNEFHGGATYAYRDNYLGAEAIRGSKIKVKNYGFTLGGPIIKDRLHFFLAPEWQQRESPSTGPNVGAAGDVALNISVDSIAKVQDLAKRFFDPGTSGPIPIANPLTNLFGRLDLSINSQNRAVLRHSDNTTESVAFSRNTSSFNSAPGATGTNTGFRLGSNSFNARNTNKSTVFQFFTNLSNGLSNEFLTGYNTIHDKRITPVTTPEINVGVVPTTATGAAQLVPSAVITFGTEQSSIGNQADQNILEIMNNVSLPMGNHTFTVGARYENSKVYNYFNQGAGGYYVFPNIKAFEDLKPTTYRYSYDQSGTGNGVPVQFKADQVSAYAQDQFQASPNFTLTYGLRVDIPSFLNHPLENKDFNTAFNTAAAGTLGYSISTADVPKRRPLVSPRIGFNWDVNGDLTTQVRANIGVYTANVPFILVGNAYGATGLGRVSLVCTSTDPGGVPSFTADITKLRKACGDVLPEPAPGAAGTSGVNTNDKNFKYPQYGGFSAGFDHQLPGGFVLTLEALGRRSINGLFIRDLNIKQPRLTAAGQPYRDRNGRVLYADTISATGGVTFTGANGQKFLSTYKGVNFTGGNIYLTNQNKDYNVSGTAQLKKRFGSSVELSVAYTRMRSEDVQSLTSDQAASNWANGKTYAGLESDPVLGTSAFERRNRVLSYGTWTLPNKLTDISFIYEGRSGNPITYTSNGDLNGDGNGTNDPLYIPRDATNINEIKIGTQTAGVFTQDLAAARAFNQFISDQPCLDKQRGSIVARNSCTSPFQHFLDASVRQAVPQIMGQRLSLQVDIVNFLNLLNRNWGQNRLPRNSNNFPQQQALQVTGRTPGPLGDSYPVYTFNSALRASGPWVKLNGVESNYRFQLTARYAF